MRTIVYIYRVQKVYAGILFSQKSVVKSSAIKKRVYFTLYIVHQLLSPAPAPAIAASSSELHEITCFGTRTLCASMYTLGNLSLSEVLFYATFPSKSDFEL